MPSQSWQQQGKTPPNFDHTILTFESDDGKSTFTADVRIDANRSVNVGGFKTDDFGSVSSRNKTITVKKVSPCMVQMYIHMWFDPAAASGCTKQQSQMCIDRFHAAVSKYWQLKLCRCKDEELYYLALGCTFSVKIVWHKREMAGDGGGPKTLDVKLLCGKMPGALTTFEDKIESGTPDNASWETVYAHELGHNIFDTTPSLLSGADGEGHVPRDTVARLMGKGPVKDDDRVSNQEACAAVAGYSLCNMSECCLNFVRV